MPGSSALLTRGRGSVLVVAAALVLWFLGGWMRSWLLEVCAGPILAIPWVWARRVTLGLVIDLPVSLLVLVALAAAGRVMTLRAWKTPLALVGALVALDALSAHLVLDSMRLWTDAAVAIPRLVVAAMTVVLSARLLRSLEPAHGDDEPRSLDVPAVEDERSKEDGAGSPESPAPHSSRQGAPGEEAGDDV